MRIAAVGDLHAREIAQGDFGVLFTPLAKKADILLLLGDLTANGQPQEAAKLGEELRILGLPILAILGNHDFDHDREEEIKQILSKYKITVLDGDYFVFQGVGFAGVKGFGGGFRNHLLPSFGEEVNKQFALEAVNEALKLGNALTRIPVKKKVAMIHYAPIPETVKGEPLEIYPYMGSSHLEEPLDNFDVQVAFHGHSHSGSLEGKTLKGVPVYNVALPLLKKIRPEAPYLIYEI